jgi:hypothetical protein
MRRSWPFEERRIPAYSAANRPSTSPTPPPPISASDRSQADTVDPSSASLKWLQCENQASLRRPKSNRHAAVPNASEDTEVGSCEAARGGGRSGGADRSVSKSVQAKLVLLHSALACSTMQDISSTDNWELVGGAKSVQRKEKKGRERRNAARLVSAPQLPPRTGRGRLPSPARSPSPPSRPSPPPSERPARGRPLC